jgi:hypothetical protein
MNDLISRQAAIYIASGYCHHANIAKELAKLPSAGPERMKGAWINEGRIIRCNKCKIGYATVKGMKSALTYNFCPNCGADMRGDEKSDDIQHL